jgi:hypothetical protein
LMNCGFVFKIIGLLNMNMDRWDRECLWRYPLDSFFHHTINCYPTGLLSYWLCYSWNDNIWLKKPIMFFLLSLFVNMFFPIICVLWYIILYCCEWTWIRWIWSHIDPISMSDALKACFEHIQKRGVKVQFSVSI